MEEESTFSGDCCLSVLSELGAFPRLKLPAACFNSAHNCPIKTRWSSNGKVSRRNDATP